jgi:glycosyltransferase involved in cell wall biosynthesis
MIFKFSILISTKNRCGDLLLTLQKVKHLLSQNVSCTIFDDGSTDGTSEKVKKEFPEITLLRNETSKGYIYCRNKMLNETAADFAISLDDDAHFLTQNPIGIIAGYFQENPKCGLIAARIFWGKEMPENTNSNEAPVSVKSYVGCGHIWRMKAWRDIPNYPEWFGFYGEENFASLQLFKKDWEVHYVPGLLVQHRVDLKNRTQTNKDFAFRYRRALRADWFNYFMFFPLGSIPGKMAYSIWMQFKGKILKGNFKIIAPLFLALFDLIVTFPKLIKHRNSLVLAEYQEYSKLSEAKIYWNPKKAQP